MPRKTVTEKPIVVSAGGAAAVPARRKPAAKRATRSVDASAMVEAVAEPSTEAIAMLAYSYWEARGCEGGSPEEDWLRAEQELRGAK
ncbi:MAG TPA: DUF2934 domain-containing protein [Candidatus Acidoferrales bacterium]|nr:DUF2934 domain-containing protein [Candidatus Acidoferrales bacterium]